MKPNKFEPRDDEEDHGKHICDTTVPAEHVMRRHMH